MAAFIMAGPVQASGFVLLFAVLSYFLPMLELFSNAAIALVTLRLGWKRGVQVGLVASAGLAREYLQWSPRHSDLRTLVSSAWQVYQQSKELHN